MSDKVKDRIEKDAEAYYSGVFPKIHYIAGATAERPKAWNEAIEAAKDKLRDLMEDDENEGRSALYNAIGQLEKLKHKQP